MKLWPQLRWKQVLLVFIVAFVGVFAKGSTLEHALQNVKGPEQSAQTRYLTMLTGKPLRREYSKEKILRIGNCYSINLFHFFSTHQL
jgi:hypothetical protein